MPTIIINPLMKWVDGKPNKGELITYEAPEVGIEVGVQVLFYSDMTVVYVGDTMISTPQHTPFSITLLEPYEEILVHDGVIASVPGYVSAEMLDTDGTHGTDCILRNARYAFLYFGEQWTDQSGPSSVKIQKLYFWPLYFVT